jgi:phospholipid/cholesterol/gamma-HCH transport system permease protein
MTQSVNGPGWTAHVQGSNLLLALNGDWTARLGVARAPEPEALLERSTVQGISFDSSELEHWDSSLLILLSSLREASRRHDILFDETGLPQAAQRLLSLLPSPPRAPVVVRSRAGTLDRIVEWALRRWSQWTTFIRLVGETALRVVPALRGKAQARAGDFLNFVQQAGVAALPTVALVNVLVGAIVAFVGGLELRRLGAEVYVANLIGVAEVREMTPLVTAIVMAGRTGSSYAAEIAAMQGSEEIDALRALGIPVFDYLILPRVAALTLMMPMLCIYGGALGVLGGYAVAVDLSNLSSGAFAVHLQTAVARSDILLGLAKSVVFGSWIAITSSRIGIGAGRSVTEVGHAATTAAVSGVVGVIALDALFDVCANALGI